MLIKKNKKYFLLYKKLGPKLENGRRQSDKILCERIRSLEKKRWYWKNTIVDSRWKKKKINVIIWIKLTSIFKIIYTFLF